ncbi:MAG: DUF4956 domain-containing protein [Verrucomicrobia bacterium]|nr:DUF4956 domain-containing protein [Verrucomicrobiota bacterium]
MLDWLKSEWSQGEQISLTALSFRMAVAWLCGLGVAWVYRNTHGRNGDSPSFPGTLILLAILIAMVTRVIGDNVARAFSLVGALSIVRFRTVVRDTQDTAFVIFAVVVGMAVGAGDLRVAFVGLALVAAAAFAMRRRPAEPPWEEDASLTVRIGIGLDLDGVLKSAFERHLAHHEIRSVATVKQGTAMEAQYRVRLRPNVSPAEFVKALNQIEGVQSVDLGRDGEVED